MASNIQNRLNCWKQNLLDLTFRNPFLNFRYRNKSRTTSVVAIVDESPAELFRILQMEGSSMGFLPWEEKADVEDEPEAKKFNYFEDDDLESDHLDDMIQTTLREDRLVYVLEKIGKEAQSWIDEKGVNALYLALGMLEYRDPQSADKTRAYKAPLLLLPVQLRKDEKKKTYLLSTTDGDPV